MSIQSSELYAAVTQYIEDEKVWDGLAVKLPAMSHLMKKGKQQQKGGLYIQVPIKLIANTASGFISGTNAVTSINPSIQLQYQVFNWFYYNYNVNFTLADENIATGAEEKIDFMAEKTNGALQDAIRELATSFWTAQTGYAPNGLPDAYAATGTTYGGLNDQDYGTGAFLGIYDASSTVPNYASLETNLATLESRMQDDTYSASDVMVLMNAQTYGKFKTSCQNQQVFSSSDIFKTGATGFHIDGADVYLDQKTPGTAGSTNTIVAFPKSILKMYYHFGFGTASQFDGQVKMPNQPILSIQHYMSLNFVVTNRRLLVKMSAIVA